MSGSFCPTCTSSLFERELLERQCKMVKEFLLSVQVTLLHFKHLQEHFWRNAIKFYFCCIVIVLAHQVASLSYPHAGRAVPGL